MPDVLDRLGEQLRLAEQRHYGARTSTTLAGRPRWWRRTRRRGLLLGLIALVVAAPAVALVSPWTPTVGRPGISEPTIPPSAAPYASAAAAVLGVLRRPQSAADRAAATPVLRALGHPVGGVQLDGVRALAAGWVLVPADVIDTGRDPITNQLCITNGKAIGCQDADDVAKLGVSVLAANATHTRITGLVPDRVVRVRFVTTRRTVTEVDVRNNFYSLSVAETQPTRMIPTPKDPTYKGPDRIASPPTPIGGSLQYLDDTGRIVGPLTSSPAKPAIAGAPPPAAANATRLDGIRVAIFNTTMRPTLARSASEQLNSHNARVVALGSAPSRPDRRSVVLYRPGAKEQARRVAAILGVAQLDAYDVATAPANPPAGPHASVIVLLSDDHQPDP